jgi:hypothetical protein
MKLNRSLSIFILIAIVLTENYMVAQISPDRQQQSIIAPGNPLIKPGSLGMIFNGKGINPYRQLYSPEALQTSTCIKDSVYNYYWDKLGIEWSLTIKDYFKYDSKGRLIKEYSLYKPTVSSWDSAQKSDMVYDAKGNKISETNAEWDSNHNMWLNDTRFLYTYDENGNQTEKKTQEWYGNDWADQFRITSSYFPDGKKQIENHLEWDSRILQWVSTEYDVFNEKGHAIEVNYRSWNSDSAKFLDGGRALISYINDTLIKSYITLKLNSFTQDWDTTGKYRYYYNDDIMYTGYIFTEYFQGIGWFFNTDSLQYIYTGGDMTQLNEYYWNFLVGWYKSFEEDLSYMDGKLTLETDQTLNNNGVLVNFAKYINEYFNNGGLKHSTRQSWDEGSSTWITTNENFYNEKGAIQNSYQKNWENGAYTDGSQSSYTYDNQGNNIELLSQNFENGTWVNSSDFKTYYNCNVVTSVRDLGSEFSIFPNPARNIVSISLASGDNHTTEVLITDLTGKTVLARQLNLAGGTALLDVSGFTRGIYLVIVRTEGHDYHSKLIINR